MFLETGLVVATAGLIGTALSPSILELCGKSRRTPLVLLAFVGLMLAGAMLALDEQQGLHLFRGWMGR